MVGDSRPSGSSIVRSLGNENHDWIASVQRLTFWNSVSNNNNNNNVFRVDCGMSWEYCVGLDSIFHDFRPWLWFFLFQLLRIWEKYHSLWMKEGKTYHNWFQIARENRSYDQWKLEAGNHPALWWKIRVKLLIIIFKIYKFPSTQVCKKSYRQLRASLHSYTFLLIININAHLK